MDKNNDFTAKNFMQKYGLQIIGLLFTAFNIYLASVLAPLENHISTIAAQVEQTQIDVDRMEKQGTILAQLNNQRILLLEKSVDEIKFSLIRIEDKVTK